MSEPAASACLDELELLDLADGVPSPSLSKRAETHLDGCASCRERLAEFVRVRAPVSLEGEAGPTVAATTQLAGPHGRLPPMPELPRGTSLGRYVVLDKLGAGGMGVVYAAYDPSIDRRIGLKLIRADSEAGETAQRRLLEAQAAARTQHPNVVAVHDAGTFEDCVFIAMELVEGGTLRQHLAAARPPWREVVRLYLQAGRGLAAAHAAGVIHRDFKPENVLVDRSGRVRVTDFGLARVVPAEVSAPALPESTLLASSPTRTSGSEPPRTGQSPRTALAGTPGYIAPELLAGQPADARSDQYSFCVALYEGLHGARPSSTQEPSQGSRPVLPRAVRAVLTRGLSRKPEERFPTLEALLEALEQAAFPRSRRWKLVAAGVGVVATALVVIIVSRPTPCTGSSTLLSGVWDETRKVALQQAFTASGAPTAPSLFSAASRTLDAYAQSWARAHREACEATRVRGDQSEAVMDLRMRCLELRKRELGALADVLLTVDAAGALRAPEATHALGSLDACADVEALSQPVPLPDRPEVAPRVDAAFTRLASARALLRAGRWKQAVESATAVAAESEALGYKPLLGEALLVQGLAERELRDEKAASASLRRAVQASLAGRDDSHAAEAEVYLVHVEGELAQRPEQAQLWADQARALLERLGGEPRLEALLLLHEGTALGRQGRSAEALKPLQQALVLQERLEGPEDVSLAPVHNMLGEALKGLGRLDDALAHQQRALALLEQAYGSDHPRVALALNNIGTTLVALKRYDEALAKQEECLNRLERAHGPEQPLNYVIALLSNLGSTHFSLEHYEQSERFLQRGFRLARANRPPGHPDRIRLGNNLSLLRLERGHPDEALALLKEMQAEQQSTAGDGQRSSRFAWSFANEAEVRVRTGQFELAVEAAHKAVAKLREVGADGELVVVLPLLSQALLGAGQLAEAQRVAQEALDLHHKLAGPDQPAPPEVNQVLGEVLLARGDTAGARTALEKALADWEKTGATPLTMAAARFSLARALRQGHGDATRARTLASAARDALAPMPEPRRVRLADIDAFLRAL